MIEKVMVDELNWIQDGQRQPLKKGLKPLCSQQISELNMVITIIAYQARDGELDKQQETQKKGTETEG